MTYIEQNEQELLNFKIKTLNKYAEIFDEYSKLTPINKSEAKSFSAETMVYSLLLMNFYCH